MRPYGVVVAKCIDVGDILMMAAKGSVGSLRGRSGCFRGYSRGPGKARIRRYWKRVARAEGQRAARQGD